MIYLVARNTWLLICWIELAALTILLYAVSYLPGVRGSSGYAGAFRFWCRLFVRALGVDLRLHQKNERPLPKRFIMIANHPSAFEDIGIPALFDVYCLAKEEVRDWWIVGRISEAAGTLFVKRESRESRQEASENIARTLSRNKNVALYPEGGCKGKRIHTPFRYGAFEISLQTGIPIVPVFLHYEAQDDFYWADGVLLIRKIWEIMRAKNNRANYYLFDAFDPKDFPDAESYCSHVYDRYMQWQRRYLE